MLVLFTSTYIIKQNNKILQNYLTIFDKNGKLFYRNQKEWRDDNVR